LTFAWQGFQIEHPEEWAPALISGTRDEGYARIASPDALSLQIRWKSLAQGKALLPQLVTYIRQLERDSKKTKTKFKSHLEGRDGGQYKYQWSAAGNGSGSLLWQEGRAFFIEVSSLTNRSTSSQHERIVSSFKADPQPAELWSVFGLSVRLRPQMAVEKHTFQSGRTRIEWRDKKGKVIAERWGFGEQILAKHPFEEWVKESMSMQKAKVTEVEHGLELEAMKPFQKNFGLARFEPEMNQLITLKVITRSESGRPAWDWLI
jgi:hypothetical protein